MDVSNHQFFWDTLYIKSNFFYCSSMHPLLTKACVEHEPLHCCYAMRCKLVLKLRHAILCPNIITLRIPLDPLQVGSFNVKLPLLVLRRVVKLQTIQTNFTLEKRTSLDDSLDGYIILFHNYVIFQIYMRTMN